MQKKSTRAPERERESKQPNERDGKRGEDAQTRAHTVTHAKLTAV